MTRFGAEAVVMGETGEEMPTEPTPEAGTGVHVVAPRGSEVAPARKKKVRGQTLSTRRISKKDLAELRRSAPPPEVRPARREECLQGDLALRPCPFVSCKHNLFLDVNENNGSIKLNFPGIEVWEMPESCALDVADRGGLALEDIGVLMNLTRERIRQLEARGLARLRALADLAGLSDMD